MTGHGRGQSAKDGRKLTVEIASVNRKQTEIVVNLPRELATLESRVRDVVHAAVSRGRFNVAVEVADREETAPRLDLDIALARQYRDAIQKLQSELGFKDDIDFKTILRSPGVLRIAESRLSSEEAWPMVERALADALADLIVMREREGRHLAKDLIQRLKTIRQSLKRIRLLHPKVAKRHAEALRERLVRAGLEISSTDERLAKELAIFADRSDVSEEITRLESHLAQFAHHLRSHEPVGRTLDFMTQEIFRELNTLGAKANDSEISQNVVACKAEMERIREQVQNIE